MSSNLPAVVAAAITIRWWVSLHGYSGQNKPPMHGDYEAQRHWMEVTTALPIGDWYRQTDQNDLLYWGLDYPPLTAYLSLFFGKVAELCCPELVELHTSRGHESNATKIFMRLTVIYADLILYIPTITAILLQLMKRPSMQPGIYLFIILIAPAPLLIDHGHFQYNNVSIGLSLLSGYLLCRNYDILASIFFVLALNYKQMTLYYSLVIFCILLRKCFIEPTMLGKLFKFTSLGITVITTFAILWAPFCIYAAEDETCLSSLGHVLGRLFPFNRGIFEDKVANIWFGLSVLYDFRQTLSTSVMKGLSAVLTMLLISPTLYAMLTRPPTTVRVLLGLMNGALAFFLGSFQVHEKSLLLSLVPASLLLNVDPLMLYWYQVIGVFSMFPLLTKDGHRTTYVSTLAIYSCMVAAYCNIIPAAPALVRTAPDIKFTRRLVVGISILGCILLHIFELIVKPPDRYPHLYPVLMSLYSLANLILIYIIGLYYLFVWNDYTGVGIPRKQVGKSTESLGLKEVSRKLQKMRTDARIETDALSYEDNYPSSNENFSEISPRARPRNVSPRGPMAQGRNRFSPSSHYGINPILEEDADNDDLNEAEQSEESERNQNLDSGDFDNSTMKDKSS